jgi:multicomponent Na+:H+ antiporter subunit D
MVTAAGFVALSPLLPRRLVDAIAIAAATTSTAMMAIVLHRCASAPQVYWFGGWTPQAGRAIGICFVVDPIGAGLATLASMLVLAALIFSWRYFDAVGTLYHALMLIFLAAMVAFCLTGDVFNLFVFFELMSVVAYALTGYKIEEESALEGAINFAVTNSIGGFFVLSGIGLLYGRTGALNMAQIGRSLAGHPADGLVVCALAFIVTGFLVKAAIVPFHFWLSDAHAVAPTPVCVLFSGVMVELGLYAAVRVYWTMFAGVPGLAPALSPILLGFGIVTALVGAIMCLLQRHLKRLLAFSTISHMGLFIIGFSVLAPGGLAGTAVYVAGHGLVKGALFICAGIILHQNGTVDELELLPRRTGGFGLILVYVAAALGLAGMPPFATSIGKSLIEEAVHGGAATALEAIMIIASALTAAAVLRAGGRIFFGWGPKAGEESGAPTEKETQRETRGRRWIPSVMLAPAAALVALSILIGLAPGLANLAQGASAEFENRAAYASMVLDGSNAVSVTRPEAAPELSISSGIISTVLAIALAAFELFAGGLPRGLAQQVRSVSDRLRALHSGEIGDYVTWMVVGVVVFGLTLAASLR